MKGLRWKTVILLALALLLIGIGAAAEEPSIVFQKAANICLECIGVG